MSRYKDIEAARSIVLNAIQRRTTSLKNHLKMLNQKFFKGKLPPDLMAAIRGAWLKPRSYVLTQSTVNKWQANRCKRGHDKPLKKSKDYTIYPWHELAYQLKQKYPKETYVQLLCRLNLKYPEISYGQLLRYINFVKKELEETSL